MTINKECHVFDNEYDLIDLETYRNGERFMRYQLLWQSMQD